MLNQDLSILSKNEYIFKWRSIFSFLKIRFKYLLSSLSLSFFPTDSSRSYALQNELIEIELQQKLNKGLFFTDDIWIFQRFPQQRCRWGRALMISHSALLIWTPLSLLWSFTFIYSNTNKSLNHFLDLLHHIPISLPTEESIISKSWES